MARSFFHSPISCVYCYISRSSTVACLESDCPLRWWLQETWVTNISFGWRTSVTSVPVVDFTIGHKVRDKVISRFLQAHIRWHPSLYICYKTVMAQFQGVRRWQSVWVKEPKSHDEAWVCLPLLNYMGHFQIWLISHVIGWSVRSHDVQDCWTEST